MSASSLNSAQAAQHTRPGHALRGESHDSQSPQHAGPAWWREWELGVVLILSLATFCFRLSAIPLFGEEPRRALIAREMTETGDWLVPGTQGVFLPSRPPLQNWMIAGLAYITGSFDIWAVRLPSIISTIAAAVMIYGYLRQRIGRLGSLGGAISYVTMLLVMEFGRSAETEAVFTLFVAASMMLWHWGWQNRWPAWQMWSASYACVALGLLTKGLQAPVYFTGSVGLFLLITGNWRALFSSGHAIGLLVFAVIFGAWQIPFTLQRGLADSWMMYFGDVAGRFTEKSWMTFLTHLVAYPSELLLVRLMPWSILLLAYGDRRVRAGLTNCRQSALFLTICIVFSFVFVWLPPGSKARYFMPLFPSFAALIGIAIDRLASENAVADQPKLWTNFVRSMTWLMAGSAVVVLIVSILRPDLIISLPLVSACMFGMTASTLAFVTWRSPLLEGNQSMRRAICSIAGFLAMVQVSLITTIQERRCEDIGGHIDTLKHQLPTDTRLVSLGMVHHAFAFFYGQSIPIVEMPAAQLPEGQDLFCLHTYGMDPPKLPFEWVQIDVVSCDRFKTDGVPKDRVFIGRRVNAREIGMKDKSNGSL